jgi:hypothetical protein
MPTTASNVPPARAAELAASPFPSRPRFRPVCFTTGVAARTATVAAQELLELAATILNPEPGAALVLADCEHFTAELLDQVKDRTRFERLVPMPDQRAARAQWQSLPAESFTRRWAGYATAKRPYTPALSHSGPFTQDIQREGERPQDDRYNAFLSTRDGDEVEALVGEFPKRWHVEEFFQHNEALGWDRAGTCNLNIRYGQMTMALVAEAALSQFRKRIGVPGTDWDAKHLAKGYFGGLEGDVRVVDGGTIPVTHDNAPEAARLRPHDEDLPAKLRAEQIHPRIPWLYGFQLDFRFR